MTRIYTNKNWGIHVAGLGWITENEYNKLENKIDNRPNQYEIPYIEENGETGTEDFSRERWIELRDSKQIKMYIPTLRTYREGKGNKRVADRIIEIGAIYANSRKDVTAYIKRTYTEKLEQGYEIAW